MAALNFAFGLRGGGVAEGDAVEVQGGTELGERVGNAGEEEAVAVDVETQRETVGEEGAREEVEVGEERLARVDVRTDAAAAAIIEHVEERERRAAGPPAVRGGIELPERADFAALPAPHGGFGFARGLWRSEVVGECEAADGGGIELEGEEACDLAGGEAVVGRRARGEQLAQERFDLGGPWSRVVAARGAWHPSVLAAGRTGAQIGGVKFVEPTAAQGRVPRRRLRH